MHPDSRSILETTDLESAEDFLAHLSPTGERWRCEGGWVFRGHADASWELLPAVIRDERWRDFPWARKTPRRSSRAEEDYFFQASSELAALREFAHYADLHGLDVPMTVHAMRNYPIDIKSAREYPQDDLFESLALAQHHGIPTRLLDWTRRARHAAYFAARGAATKSARSSGGGAALPGERLALWGLRVDVKLLVEGLEVVRVRKHPLARLRAQDGLFTVVRGHGANTPLERALDQIAPDLTNREFCPSLRKVTLPVGEAPKLLRLLSYENVSAASLFPDYAGVAESIEEQQLWDLPGNTSERQPRR